MKLQFFFFLGGGIEQFEEINEAMVCFLSFLFLEVMGFFFVRIDVFLWESVELMCFVPF